MNTNRFGDRNALQSYLDELGKFPPISREEEEQTVARAKKGDSKAVDHLVTSNLRFVVSVAHSYSGRGVPLQDLVAEGNLGLLKALDRFDPDRGYKFISYAVWWIHQTIRSALKAQNVVTIPSNRQDDMVQISKQQVRLAQELGRHPSLDEVADTMSISRERAQKAMGTLSPQVSVDHQLLPGSTDERRLLDILPSSEPEPDRETLSRDRSAHLKNALDACDERGAHVIRSYFGLEGRQRQTLADIGQSLGVSRERARQLKERSLAVMRRRLEQMSVPDTETWQEMV